ncbi:GMC family oxidoreductase N-terminal domain-containing protein [Streptomyces malaysiensis]|uniref:GMC family oxidoreductase N-terminal domain-containing protein n=1 Tax=Streptomyces malaysiensis subsp. samsunensis TaxID=459658 RepID=A0A9X2RUW4_STRMQ|nr:GMC family oxidoreductase N-terminal domain-containing protein [Streptomyces samsunensis]MCQ8829530.1 GMC family oxidoreductase N-terminal domain-containing protein [Streptomyces samsunensis]
MIIRLAEASSLRPVLHRRDLTVVTNAMARRLIIDGQRCRGVVYDKNGAERSAYARHEAVLAAGTIGSAQLLMVSGIGPADHLRHVGVTVKADLPGVGENLHDHPVIAVAYTASRPVRKAFVRKPNVRFSSGLSDQPDLQMVFLDSPCIRVGDQGRKAGTPYACR